MLGITILEVVISLLWLIHCWYKVGYKGMERTQIFFDENGLPWWLAWFVVSVEPIFAFYIITNRYVPLMCVAGLPILITSAWIYRKNGFFFAKGGMEFPLFWAFMQVVLALLVMRI